jgi:hypothetical protein
MHVKLLLNVARRFIGNYHPLFLEVTFMKEIDAVYRREMMPSTLWLCKFYALMALGEIYTHRRGVGDNNRVPGTNYYVRAVSLLQENPDYYEEPSLMQVEVLTLLVRHHTLPFEPLAKQSYRLGRPTSWAVYELHIVTVESPCVSPKVLECTGPHQGIQRLHLSSEKVEGGRGGCYTSLIASQRPNLASPSLYGTKISMSRCRAWKA